MATSLCTVVLAALLSACATVSSQPPPLASAALPASWDAPALQAALVAAEAPRFGDIDDALLPALVAEALAANLDVAGARTTLERAHALADVAAAGQAPQLGTRASIGRSRSQRVESSSLGAGVDASWEADVFGANAAASAAARADAEAGAALLDATRLAIAGETALAYLAWQRTRSQLEVARASFESLQQTRELVGWRVQAGLASALDAEQAASSVAQAEAQLPALQSTLEQNAHRLAVLLALPPRALAERLAAAPRGVPRVAPLPAPGVPADLLRRRPDLRAAELNARSAWATLAARRAEQWPTFTLGGSLALQAASWSTLGGPAALAASVAAAVRWPLADGGAAAARVRAQQAAYEATRIAWQATLLGALQDVDDNLVALARGAEREAALTQAVDAAERSLALARQRYGAGLADFGTLLDSERTLLASRDSLAAARSDLAQARVRLAKALGGDVAPPTLRTQPS